MDIEWELKKLELWEYPEGYTRDEELFLLRGLCREDNYDPKYVACYCIEDKIDEAKKEAEIQVRKAWEVKK